MIRNDSRDQAGTIEVASTVKTAKFVTFCNTFNIPLAFFHDVPGVLIGKHQEEQAIVSKIMDLIGALRSCSVPGSPSSSASRAASPT